MKIYIDITKLLGVSYLTGIQRVVREIVLRILQKQEEEIVLISYNEGYHLYEIVDGKRFQDYFEYGIGERKNLVTDQVLDWQTLQAGDILFDIDGVWNLPLRRSVLLPQLKANGVKLVVYIYDIIPITHPQFFFGETLNNFMNYIGAYLQYADLIMASAQSTLDAIDILLKQLELPKIPGVVTWLGSDFNLQKKEDGEVAEEALKAVEAGTYVLMIGTIEPRKNHALVLDAFDHVLFDKGMNVIFAGRIGWNVEDFQKRMEKHPKKDKQFYFLQGMNDATIDYLYKHAFCVAFPTFNEGFGLPIIESYQRGVPVLASDIPILREVGGDYCAYFDPDSWESFANVLLNWIEHPEEYTVCKERLQTYEPVTWDAVADTIWNALCSLKTVFPYSVPNQVKQMVYLTARLDDLLASLPFVEKFMSFIEELVICCPDAMVDAMKQQYHGRFRLQFLTDSQVLDGAEMPKDHVVRNFYLRCLTIRQDMIDDVFIMADDDYRPLSMISQDVFLKDGIYQGYYCYKLEHWKGDQVHPSSFDFGMFRTFDFLEKHGYPTWMYEAHMPQLIDRRIFNDLLNEHVGIELSGLSEWSAFFNYLNAKYPLQLESHPFVTMTWPGNPSAWDMEIYPEQVLFENYYKELYDSGEMFEGFSREFYEGIEEENQRKIVKYLNVQAEHNQARVMFQAYCANYEMLYGEWPFFGLDVTENQCKILLPEYVAISENNFTRIPFMVTRGEDKDIQIELSYRIMDIQGNELQLGETMDIELTQDILEVPIKSIHGGIKAILEIKGRFNDIETIKCTKLCVMKKGI